MQQQDQAYTLTVSERSLRRVQITVAALQAADQTAKAAAEAAQGMVAQARKSLDEALGAISDANDKTLPKEYTVKIDVNERTLTIISADDAQVLQPGQSLPGAFAPFQAPTTNGEVAPSPPMDPAVPLDAETSP